MRAIVLSMLLAGCGLTAAGQQTSKSLQVMPYPAQVDFGEGRFLVDQWLTVALSGHQEPRLERAAQRFLRNLERLTGVPMSPQPAQGSSAKLVIHTQGPGKKVQELGEDESYRLLVTPSSVRLEAANPLGALRGLETLLQMVEPTAEGFALPPVTIQDRPRFPWRGLLLDSCRHWMPVEAVQRILDGMAAVKMNVLHWHLSEDQGFRVESKRFPRLHQMGSDGLYYTQQEVRDLIEYARDRGIRVVPEFDMPGHTTAWFAGHPELASQPGPYPIERRWGIFDPAMDPTREETYKFLGAFIAEMAALFPDPYFHIGGDEVTGKHWDANPAIRQFMKQNGLKDNHDLQAYFNRRVQKMVAAEGKVMMGWDEVLHPDLPKDIVVQTYRGPKALAEAARRGYRGLLSHGYYLDLMFSAGYHYSFDPLGGEAADLTPEEKQRILGGEACMWTEYVSTENVDSRLWPRAAAIAERLWSPQELRDETFLYARLEQLSAKLTRWGMTHDVNYRPMLERIAGSPDTAVLKAVADVVEPVKEYLRGQLGQYTQSTPLNRLIDAARPESIPARDFRLEVERFLSGGARPQAEGALRTSLELWRDQRERFRAQAQNSFLMQEAAPVSEDLARTAEIGLEALRLLKSGAAPQAGWAEAQLQFLEEAKKPRASVLIMIVPGVEHMVRAAATPR